MTGDQAASRWWITCFDFVGGPFDTREVAEHVIAGISCPYDHEVVESDVKPVSRYEQQRDALERRLAERKRADES